MVEHHDIPSADQVRQHMLALKQSPVWQSLPASDLRTIAEIAQVEVYEHEQLICQQGERFKGIYIVQKGYIETVRREGDETFTVAEFGPGESLGEADVVESVASLFSLRAKGTTVALVLNGEQFRDLLQNLASVRMLLLTRMTNYLRANF